MEPDRKILVDTYLTWDGQIRVVLKPPSGRDIILTASETKFLVKDIQSSLSGLEDL